MWYRIELNKDGSVHSCVEAAPSLEQGRLVVFVEAATKALALEASVVRRRQRKVQYDVKLKNLGLCVNCRRPASHGKTRCDSCCEQKRSEDRQRKAGTFVKLTGEQRSALRTGRPKTNNERLILLYECRKVFDEQGSKAFRKWLQAQIDASFTAEEREGAAQ